MSPDFYRREIARIKSEIAKLEQKQADERNRAVRARGDAQRLEASISKHTSQSTAAGKLRQAQRKLEQAAAHEKKAGKHGDEVAQKLRRLDTAEKNLSRALAQEDKKREEKEKKRRRDEERHAKEMEQQQRRLAQKAASERRAELVHEQAVTDEVSRRARYAASVSATELRRLPEKVTILFASAGPRDEDRLDIAEEARDVESRLRGSEHRDAVELKHVPALRTSDLIPALNQHRPRVVHFAGHGSDKGNLLFQDEEGNAKPVELEALAATIATMADHVQLVVLNACHSGSQALALTEHVPASIGMSETIGDEAARIFATALYGAIADGFSIQRAFLQGVAQLQLDGLPDDEMPQLFTSPGTDADALVLVRPEGDDFDASLAA
jgi:hypothetical protein